MRKYPAVPLALRRQVFARAGGRCEYCLLPFDWEMIGSVVEHVISRKHRGSTTLENLAASCSHCNLHKSSDVAGLDPSTGKLCRLFNPRTDKWPDHFQFRGASAVGRTAIGRTTVYVLNINSEIRLAIRTKLIAADMFFWLQRGL